MFRNRLYLAMISGHFVVDILNSIGGVLLAVLAVPLGLTNAQIGLALTVYIFAGSLSQPLFGWLADRLPRRTALLAGVSIVWMALLYAGVAMAQSWSMLLPFFLLAALGSGLFHPIGTAVAAGAVPEQAGRATAIFFFCGQMGLAMGPILAGLLFGSAGSLGILPLAAVALIPAGLLLLAMGKEGGRMADHERRSDGAPRTAHNTPRTARREGTPRWSMLMRVSSLLIVAFIVLVAVRSSIQATFQSFLPKLFADRGWEPEMYGLLTGVFMGSAAIGNIFTGDIADRFGMRAATVWPLLLSIPAGLICVLAPSLPAAFIACAFAGVTVGGQHSVLVVHAQRLLPVKKGFAAGLILGFTFASGAFGTWIVGIAADSYSLPLMMEIMALLGLPAALLALTLPGRPRDTAPISTAAPVSAAGTETSV